MYLFMYFMCMCVYSHNFKYVIYVSICSTYRVSAFIVSHVSFHSGELDESFSSSLTSESIDPYSRTLYLPKYLPTFLPTYMPIYLPSYLSTTTTYSA